jgi:hypothetical protein
MAARVRAASAVVTAVVTAVALTVGAAACGTSGHRPTVLPTVSPSASASPTIVAPPSASAPAGAASPLTGLAVSSLNLRPIVAVVVAGGFPYGLRDADVVIEEYSIPVRDLALFQSRQSTQIGPVGDTRPLDTKALKVMKPIFAYNGGPAGMVKQVTNQGLFDASFRLHPQAYFVRGSAVYAATSNLYALGTPSTAASLFPFVQADSPPPAGVHTIRQLTVTIPGRTTQVWSYDSHASVWRRTVGGAPVAVATVAFQNVPYKSVELVHGHGQFVPSAVVFGSGTAVVTYGPGLVTGRWSKVGAEGTTLFTDPKGVAVRFMRGQSFIGLLPPGSRVIGR